MTLPTLIMLIAIVLAWTWVSYHAIGIWQTGHAVCICGHIRGRHVSALDWDSDYGNPGRMGGVAATYRKPGECRECYGRCRTFIPLAERGSSPR